MSLPIEPNRFPSQVDLEKLGLWKDIDRKLFNGKWTDMISIRDPYYHELFIEFLAFFFMDKKGINYKKRGCNYV